MRGKAHSDEVRAEVIAALLQGQGVTEVAERYKLPKQTVSDLKNEIAPAILGQVRTEKRERIGDLIEKHLRTSLESATGIAQKVNNSEWVAKQNASDVAVLFGVLTDKAIRILEAAESEEPEGRADLDASTEAATGSSE